MLLINSSFYHFITYFRAKLSYAFDNQLKDITLRKIDSIFKTMKERDSRLDGLKEIATIYDSISDFVKRNLD